MDSQENRIRRIVLERIGTCRVCHRQHQGGDVRVISQQPDKWTMVVECPDCHSRSFVAAVVDERHAEEAREDLRRLADEQIGSDIVEEFTEYVDENLEPISEADVAEMASFLETFNGDFKTLFNS